MTTTCMIADFFFVNENGPNKSRLNIAVNGMTEKDINRLQDGSNYAIVRNDALTSLQNQVNKHFEQYGLNMDLQVVRFVRIGYGLSVCATIDAVDGLFYQVN